MLRTREWYEKFEPDPDDPLGEVYAYENTVIAVVGLAQVMVASVVSTIGRPFRQPWFKNTYHVGCLVVQLIFLIYLLLSRDDSYFVTKVIQIKPLPYSFCFILIIIVLSNCAASALLSKLADKLK